jgi:S1-C subfamily serine protease
MLSMIWAEDLLFFLVACFESKINPFSMKPILILACLLSSSLYAVDFNKQFFNTLEIDNMPLVKAVDRINKIHSSQSDGQPEFLILLQDPVNMNDEVSLTLRDVNLKLLLDILLSGTNYNYTASGQYIIIQRNNSNPQEMKVADALYARDSVCLVEVNPSSESELRVHSLGGSGTGFLCKINGVNFFVTNIHVIESANSISDISVRTRDNVVVELTNGFVAQDRDLCIFRLKKNPKLKYLTISKSVSSQQLNDPIHLLGYPLGGGILRKADGTLDGVGSSLIELNCSAFAGNSGGPVLNSVTNEVIGVLTSVEIVSKDKFTELARKKLTNPIDDDIRTYATRLDTVQQSSWEPLVWHIWRNEKERIYHHQNALFAIASLVDSNYKPGTLVTDQSDLIKDPDIWRAYSKCQNDFTAAVSKGDDTLRASCLLDFVNFIEYYYRPLTGPQWKELSRTWKYEWFVSRQSGNIGFGKVEEIKHLYHKYHDEWNMMKMRWGLDY